MADSQTTIERHVCTECGSVSYEIVPDECECMVDQNDDDQPTYEEIMRSLEIAKKQLNNYKTPKA